ncbi:MAG: ATP-binding cassette domain-containing protein, partial [Betaproteobacteria bacterium]|nr:ATP-binding cassette domain-containing protein [Betaproteobacteria bacterium]
MYFRLRFRLYFPLYFFSHFRQLPPIDRSMNPPLVDLKGLKFAWTEHDPLIDLASWQVQAGEQLLISGPSGCGKSTLLA